MSRAQPDNAPTIVDLSAFDALSQKQEEGIVVEIVHPATGAPIGMTVTVAGPDSERHKAAQRAAIDRRIRKRKMVVTAAEIETESQRAMVARVIAWTGAGLDGRVLDCTPENVAMIFTRYPFIYAQIDAETSERASFF